MVAQLVGPDVRHFGGKLNLKAAGFGSPVEWHQDFAFAPRTNDDLLAVGVAIDEMNEENGCMMMIPGSHCGTIYNHHQGNLFVGGISDTNFCPEKFVPVELEAGDISIHHGRTIHGSASNTTLEKQRRLYLLQMCAADSWRIKQIHGPGGDQEENMLRGKAPDEPRWVEFPPVPTPKNEQTSHGGSIYETQTQLQLRFLT